MAKNFDEGLEQDLTFTVRGETFRAQFVRPEVLSAWEDEPVDTKSDDALKRIDDRIMLFLDPENGNMTRWKKLRARKKDPVTMGQLNAIIIWMVEVQAGRPTITPSPSDSGRGRTEATSTVGLQ